MKALAAQIGDIDVELCDILKVGAPTGVRQRVPPSGVWPLCEGEREVHADFDIDLQWCRHNHASADSDEKSVAALIQKEMDAGFMELVGDEAAVRKRFPSGQLAVGKLGVVRSAGKDDRLIGDSRASGASPAAKFSERAELPSLYHFGAALSRGGSRHSDWSLFSLDIKGAHKSIRTAREDTGFFVFQFQGQYYVYLVNHFGAAWSAYWWSRLGGLLMRLAHHLLRHKHLGGVYVDDFLFFLPRQCAAAMAAQLTALFQILGVPLPWKKLRLGFSLAFLGWDVSVREGCFACVTAEKQVKLDREMQVFLKNPRKVSRQGLVSLLGLLIWATQARLTLRSFLAPLHRAAHARSQKLACLSLEQVEELLPLLNGDLEVVSSPGKSDVQKGWRLAGVGAHGCRDLGMVRCMLQQPKLRNGKIWLRFLAWGSSVKLPPAAVAALKVLRQQLLGQQFSLMQPTSQFNGAADAWAGLKQRGSYIGST